MIRSTLILGFVDHGGNSGPNGSGDSDGESPRFGNFERYTQFSTRIGHATLALLGLETEEMPASDRTAFWMGNAVIGAGAIIAVPTVMTATDVLRSTTG